jgi:hypothetical protein
VRATQVAGEERWTFYATEEESTCSLPRWKENVNAPPSQHKRDQKQRPIGDLTSKPRPNSEPAGHVGFPIIFGGSFLSDTYPDVF